MPNVVIVSDPLGAAEALRRNFRLAALEREVRDLRTDLEKLQTTLVVPINSFAPEPFDVVGPLQAVVRPVGDGYVASVFDANISASGDTEQDAIDGLKEVMLMVLEDLESEPAERLGVEAKRQLAVLQSSIRRR